PPPMEENPPEEPPVEEPPVVDMKAPVIQWKEKPSETTTSKTARFIYEATDESGIEKLECKLNNSTVTCQSPQIFENLNQGTHKFEVRATDKAGNTSNWLAYQWTI